MARFFIAPFHGNVIQLAGRAVHGPKIYAPQGIFFLPALYAHAGGVPQWNGGPLEGCPAVGRVTHRGVDLKSTPSALPDCDSRSPESVTVTEKATRIIVTATKKGPVFDTDPWACFRCWIGATAGQNPVALSQSQQWQGFARFLELIESQFTPKSATSPAFNTVTV